MSQGATSRYDPSRIVVVDLGGIVHGLMRYVGMAGVLLSLPAALTLTSCGAGDQATVASKSDVVTVTYYYLPG